MPNKVNRIYFLVNKNKCFESNLKAYKNIIKNILFSIKSMRVIYSSIKWIDLRKH